MKAGYDGINKVVNQFVSKYPNVSKRQTELKIAEIAIKEKREEDKGKVWHIRPQYAHYLNMDTVDAAAVIAGPAAASNTSEDKKRKSLEETSKKKKHGSDSNASKRKREEDLHEPKKFKNAFNIFVKRVRAQAENELKAKAGVSPSVRLLHHSFEITYLGVERGVEVKNSSHVG